MEKKGGAPAPSTNQQPANDAARLNTNTLHHHSRPKPQSAGPQAGTNPQECTCQQRRWLIWCCSPWWLKPCKKRGMAAAAKQYERQNTGTGKPGMPCCLANCAACCYLTSQPNKLAAAVQKWGSMPTPPTPPAALKVAPFKLDTELTHALCSRVVVSSCQKCTAMSQPHTIFWAHNLHQHTRKAPLHTHTASHPACALHQPAIPLRSCPQLTPQRCNESTLSGTLHVMVGVVLLLYLTHWRTLSLNLCLTCTHTKAQQARA